MVGNVVTSHYRGQLSHYRATFSGISGGRPPERDESLSPLSDSLTSAEVPEEVPARKRRISNKTPCSAGGTVADIYIYIYKGFWLRGEASVGNLELRELRGLSCFPVLWSLRPAQNRPARAQSRSEPLRIAQSVPRAAQSRPERSLRAVRGTALGRPEPLRVARSGRSGSPRAAQNPSERAQSRSEPPRAFAQSCSRNLSGSPRTAQSRPERSLSVAQSYSV